MLDVEGSMETARQGSKVATSQDRRIDQVVGVLDRYGVVVCALQETKWFGSEVYKVGESLVLTAGREVPGAGHVRQRGEGVAIVLSGPAIGAWKAGGSCWKVLSSRLVEATLVTGSRSCDHLHVLSCMLCPDVCRQQGSEGCVL